MRKPLGKQLYSTLVDNEFNFIGGEKSIKEVYKLVEKKYPNLCDNTLLCCDNCKSTDKAPEWKHIVRNALQVVKKNGVIDSSKWGWWLFPEVSILRTFMKRFFAKWD